MLTLSAAKQGVGSLLVISLSAMCRLLDDLVEMLDCLRREDILTLVAAVGQQVRIVFKVGLNLLAVG